MLAPCGANSFLLQQIFKDQQEQQQIQIHHAQLLVQSKTLQHDIEQAQQQYLSAQKAREQVQELFAQQRLLQTQSVQDLRAQLQPDTACMVCGSNEHPLLVIKNFCILHYNMYKIFSYNRGKMKKHKLMRLCKN